MSELSSEKPRLSDRKRRAIIEAAVVEFNLTGFEATTMDAIANRAQVSKRTVYNHFASKEELFREIKNELVRRAFEVGAVEYDPDVSVAEQLTEIGRREVGLMVSDEVISLARVTIPAFIHCPSFASEAFTDFQRRAENIERWVRVAAEDGQLTVSDPKRAAQQFTALLKAFAFWPHLVSGQPVPDSKEQTEIIRSSVEMFLSHYGNSSK